MKLILMISESVYYLVNLNVFILNDDTIPQSIHVYVNMAFLFSRADLGSALHVPSSNA